MHIEEYMKTWENSGIYQIKNIINDKIYIGSSVDIKKRFREHKRGLKNNKHCCKHLQRAYVKYGVEAFEYTIIMTCPPIKNILLFFEQHYLDIYWDGCKNCYNICKLADSPLGYKHTQETKLKMLKNRPDISGEKHPMYGRHGKDNPNTGSHRTKEQKVNISISLLGRINGPHSKECKLKISIANLGENNNRSKLTWEQVRKIRALYEIGNITHKELATNYGVCRQTITYIISNKLWKIVI